MRTFRRNTLPPFSGLKGNTAASVPSEKLTSTGVNFVTDVTFMFSTVSGMAVVKMNVEHVLYGWYLMLYCALGHVTGAVG